MNWPVTAIVVWHDLADVLNKASSILASLFARFRLSEAGWQALGGG